jgi:hypothetical protein
VFESQNKHRKRDFLNKKPIFNSSVTTLNGNETIGTLLFKDLNFNQDNINSWHKWTDYVKKRKSI